MSDDFDVVILGAGPAGSVLGERLSRRGYGVALVEPHAFPRYAVGESLPPSVELLLKKVGILPQDVPLDFPQTTGYAWAWGKSTLRFTPHDAQGRRHGHQVERATFDAILLEAALAAGARIFSGWRPIELSHRASGWQAGIRSQKGKTQTMACRFLCDASGRARVLGRKLKLTVQRSGNLIGLLGYWGLSREDEAGNHNTLVESVPDGWCYTARLAGGKRVAGFMTDRGLLPANLRPHARAIHCSALRKTRHVKQQLVGARLSGEVRIFAANPTLAGPGCGPDWLLVGDAASTLDPLCSQGVQKAIASALAAATVVHTILKHPERTELAREFYCERERNGFATHLAALSTYYQREQRWAQRPFWKVRAAALETLRPSIRRRTDGQATLAAGDRLVPSLDATVKPHPVIEGEFVTLRPVAFAPGATRGLRYCDGLCVPDLLSLLDGARLADIVPRYLSRHGEVSAASVWSGMVRLLEMGIVTPMPEPGMSAQGQTRRSARG